MSLKELLFKLIALRDSAQATLNVCTDAGIAKGLQTVIDELTACCLAALEGLATELKSPASPKA